MTDAARNEFARFDLDGDGFISPEEIREVNAALGVVVSDEELEEMVKAADLNGDGQISLEEFLALMGKGKHAAN